MLLMLY